MRRRKYPDELALIREAVRAVEAGHHAARATIRPGVTELDVYNAINTAMVNEVGHAILPIGDYVSGERAFAIRGGATNRRLQRGDVMIIDLFPIVNGYRADFTATVSVEGELSERQQALEQALHEAQKAGEMLLKPGTRAGDVYGAVKDTLAHYGFADGFPHHAGHGLGLDHPEPPYFVPNSDETLLAGDVVTVEPGSYGTDWGGRIEHNYHITETGFERLTNHSTAFTR
jgi:Xaa-Pro dipeptidase